MSSPAPKSPEQSDRSKRYDRQLRLWGDHGQKLLENAKICLINATALGTEILKNLVLPGIGAFTIVDGEQVTEEDIGSNFFLEADSLGTPRAKAVTCGLLELNPDVQGDYIDESAEHVLTHRNEFFNGFTIIIATALTEKSLILLSKQLWAAGVPLFVCRSVGFLGYVRLQVQEHTVTETHPDNEAPDLRLDQPWPALKSHLDKIDITSLSTKERSHVPALVIVYYYLQKFINLHGSLPKIRKDKDELRQIIRDNIPVDDEGVPILGENYEQALQFVNTCVSPTTVPLDIRSILNDENCTRLSQESNPFWLMCAALKEFVETEGCLPIKGVLPDMAADTTSYITLQQIYQRQAQFQAESIYRQATQISRGLGLPSDTISEAEVKLLCKHASELHVLRTTCMAGEYENVSQPISSYLDDPESLMFYYVILKGVERFISEYNAYPGNFDEQVEPDVIKLKAIIVKLLTEWGCSSASISDERVHEVCRYGGAELHSVSAVLGGCVAHEAIKLITHQYRPINNTFIYDAITSSSGTFTL